MLTFRNIHGGHSGKNQAKASIPVIDEYASKEKLDYFMTDKLSRYGRLRPVKIILSAMLATVHLTISRLSV